ncbi:TrmH family RNA methyltransferase [Croceivirga thetidis]|uniref:RNA methyltransferase n=1 Tax=Croceivirga thetidis TaxID=2721623 RepID=A0ABX1GKD2_9FLAO|nr:RNA methyltransferase [Croceivirga thetidis]NKI30362.1 RNA methyltransferase [Croceivirga thetidis]
MVAKSQLKLIKKLHQKKYRNENKLFFVEGIKVITDLLASGLKPFQLLATEEKIESFPQGSQVDKVAANDLKTISALKNPNGYFGVFHHPKNLGIDFEDWILALDAVQDPGNLGTIIRLCDWFGIAHLVCSNDTVDCFNPKVVQATMGSIARVNIHYLDLSNFLDDIDVPVLGAFMNGNSVYNESFRKPGVLLMGNEANGISTTLEALISKKISIPQFGNQTTESLNVAMATGILLNEIRRI